MDFSKNYNYSPNDEGTSRRAHQRRRCEENCIYARYFPSERAENFQNVHRLFGINTTIKLINSVNENDRDKTIETIILEAKIRKENPVHGPLEVENKLRTKIEEAKNELEIVNKQLKFFRGNNEAPSAENNCRPTDEGTSQSVSGNFTP
ncbi:hypothetical protein DH2020_018633 [Rehmannia glutinosa]|uniref:LOB domain-containing protein n=1 Tax=Rehmannia glutinosa TaxID=99300 RepID=A0ABR0WM97_REHGL